MIVDCEGLVLRDADGNARARLSVDGDGTAALSMLDGFGTVRLKLTVAEDGRSLVAAHHAGGPLGVCVGITEKGQPTFFVRSSDEGRAGFLLTVPNDDEAIAGFFDQAGGVTAVWPLLHRAPPGANEHDLSVARTGIDARSHDD